VVLTATCADGVDHLHHTIAAAQLKVCIAMSSFSATLSQSALLGEDPEVIEKKAVQHLDSSADKPKLSCASAWFIRNV